MDYMTLKEAGAKWGITPRQINYYCAEGRIPGAQMIGRIWLIPKAAKNQWTDVQNKGELLNMNKILIIDDDKELCALMKKCIEQENMSAMIAHDGIEGLTLIDENNNDSSLSLIILDVMMQGMDGVSSPEENKRNKQYPCTYVDSEKR